MSVEFDIAACCGALLPELIRIAKGPTAGVFNSPGYWVQLLAQVAAGVLAAYYLVPEDAKSAFSIGAGAVGFSVPQVLTRAMAASTPTPPVAPPKAGAPPRFDPRIWWSR